MVRRRTSRAVTAALVLLLGALVSGRPPGVAQPAGGPCAVDVELSQAEAAYRAASAALEQWEKQNPKPALRDLSGQRAVEKAELEKERRASVAQRDSAARRKDAIDQKLAGLRTAQGQLFPIDSAIAKLTDQRDQLQGRLTSGNWAEIQRLRARIDQLEKELRETVVGRASIERQLTETRERIETLDPGGELRRVAGAELPEVERQLAEQRQARTARLREIYERLGLNDPKHPLKRGPAAGKTAEQLQQALDADRTRLTREAEEQAQEIAGAETAIRMVDDRLRPLNTWAQSRERLAQAKRAAEARLAGVKRTQLTASKEVEDAVSSARNAEEAAMVRFRERGARLRQDRDAIRTRVDQIRQVRARLVARQQQLRQAGKYTQQADATVKKAWEPYGKEFARLKERWADLPSREAQIKRDAAAELQAVHDRLNALQDCRAAKAYRTNLQARITRVNGIDLVAVTPAQIGELALLDIPISESNTVVVDATFPETVRTRTGTTTRFTTRAHLVANFGNGTITGTLKGSGTHDQVFNCYYPNVQVPQNIVDNARVRFTFSYSANVSGRLEPSGFFQANIRPTGNTPFRVLQRYTHGQCTHLNSGRPPGSGPLRGDGLVTGTVSRNGAAFLTTNWNWTTADAEVSGTWRGGGAAPPVASAPGHVRVPVVAEAPQEESRVLAEADAWLSRRRPR